MFEIANDAALPPIVLDAPVKVFTPPPAEKAVPLWVKLPPNDTAELEELLYVPLLVKSPVKVLGVVAPVMLSAPPAAIFVAPVTVNVNAPTFNTPLVPPPTVNEDTAFVTLLDIVTVCPSRMVTLPLLAVEPGHVPTGGTAQVVPFQRSQVVFSVQLVEATERKSFNVWANVTVETNTARRNSNCFFMLNSILK